MSKLRGIELDEFGIPRTISYMSVGNRMKLKIINLKELFATRGIVSHYGLVTTRAGSGMGVGMVIGFGCPLANYPTRPYVLLIIFSITSVGYWEKIIELYHFSFKTADEEVALIPGKNVVVNRTKLATIKAKAIKKNSAHYLCYALCNLVFAENELGFANGIEDLPWEQLQVLKGKPNECCIFWEIFDVQSAPLEHFSLKPLFL